MRLGCPIDEPVHLIIWHLMPVVFVVVLSTLAGAAWLRLRPRVTYSDHGSQDAAPRRKAGRARLLTEELPVQA